VRPGDVIRAHSRIKDVAAHKLGTRVQQEIAMHVVGNERPSVVVSAITLYAPPREV
jgi:hypothetical protein